MNVCLIEPRFDFRFSYMPCLLQYYPNPLLSLSLSLSFSLFTLLCLSSFKTDDILTYSVSCCGLLSLYPFPMTCITYSRLRIQYIYTSFLDRKSVV